MNAYRILMDEPIAKLPGARLTRWEGNIKMCRIRRCYEVDEHG
jgi:hypothetical protein